MNVHMEPKEVVTGFLDVPGMGPVRLDFLITQESGAFYIRCLDFAIMSCGETVEECKENIKEAIAIYLEDLPEGQRLFKPSPPRYWRMFYELRYQREQKEAKEFSRREEHTIDKFLQKHPIALLQYAWRSLSEVYVGWKTSEVWSGRTPPGLLTNSA